MRNRIKTDEKRRLDCGTATNVQSRNQNLLWTLFHVLAAFLAIDWKTFFKLFISSFFFPFYFAQSNIFPSFTVNFSPLYIFSGLFLFVFFFFYGTFSSLISSDSFWNVASFIKVNCYIITVLFRHKGTTTNKRLIRTTPTHHSVRKWKLNRSTTSVLGIKEPMPFSTYATRLMEWSVFWHV